MPRLLDLFCGRWGWSRAFAKRGWECVGVDLVESLEIRPENCEFYKTNVLYLTEIRAYDFIVASPPCEQFSVHGMKHFHKNPPYPELGIKLFNHTRQLCEESGLPYVIENVRSAQRFVGLAVRHCGPFYLWGRGVPLLMPQGIQKGISHGGDSFKYLTIEQRRERRKLYRHLQGSSKSEQRKTVTADAATIPPELANCVADYAERILEQREAHKATNPASQASA